MKESQLFAQYVRTALRNGSSDLVGTTSHLFSIGYRLDQSGAQESAGEVYHSVITALLELKASTELAISDSTIAQCAMRHGVHLCKLGRFFEARAAFRFTVETLDQVISFDSTTAVVEQLANAVRLYAFAARRCGDTAQARRLFRRSVALYRSLLLVTRSPSRARLLQQFLTQSVRGFQRSAHSARTNTSEME